MSTATGTGPAGALTGLWPVAPEAPVIVPIPGFWREQAYQRDLHRIDPPLSPVFVLDHDTFYFGATRDGLLVTTRQSELGLRYSLAAVTVVQPGTISGLRKPFNLTFGAESGREFVYGVGINNGPAVWLQTKGFGCIVPTPDPQRLAAEIERRRWRVASLGSARATKTWQAAPELRVQGPGGPQPGVPVGTPTQPPLVGDEGGAWTSLQIAQLDAPSAVDIPAGRPEPLTDVPYPEAVGDVVLPLHASSPPLVVNVSNHRVRLSQQPLPAGQTPFLDPDIEFTGPSLNPSNPYGVPRPYLTAPIVQFPVIRAGTLSGVPAGWSVRVLASDARTEIRTDIEDGPAVWLWGVAYEWILCTPYAEELAADLNQRRRIASLYPWIGQYAVEKLTWDYYPETALVETDAGWCLPPTPTYAPREPTILPPGTWRSDPV